MTRKTIVAVLAAAVLMAAAARPASGQPGPDTRPVKLYVNLGYVNLFSQPKWISLGPEIELRLGRLFTVNPDVAIWFRQSFVGKSKIVPGATLNVKLGRFFVGGGAVHRVADWPELPAEVGRDRGWLMPKVQIGYLTGQARLTAYALIVGAADDVAIGLNLSMGIGRPTRD